MEVSWRPLGGLLEASWRPLGGLLEASWRPLGGLGDANQQNTQTYLEILVILDAILRPMFDAFPAENISKNACDFNDVFETCLGTILDEK